MINQINLFLFFLILFFYFVVFLSFSFFFFFCFLQNQILWLIVSIFLFDRQHWIEMNECEIFSSNLKDIYSTCCPSTDNGGEDRISVIIFYPNTSNFSYCESSQLCPAFDGFRMEVWDNNHLHAAVIRHHCLFNWPLLRDHLCLLLL